ncbi:hypothetical protein DEU56DRAFT_789016 [Suillus clintonianus]|uniref:uncharacterized protein n=1 Tax=Suillus clintonianus TaxID=1904413 RepID=UPI001B87346F|nr:uncharacterized protein DEU56DRAFT_789016 [Suillus clintonianus]KAG2145133.1 hypothetical protein DEU56DRAFT_789016 [Suillus clintonianus]
MISSIMTITARVAVTGFLTVSCFKRTVVDNTAQVLSEAEKVSAGLIAYSVCMSTITLVLAADAAAQRILSKDAKDMPAAPKDADADFSPPSHNDNTASATPNTVELHHLQPSSSSPPSPSRLIESQPSPAPSSLRLIEPQPPPSPSSRLIESQPSPSPSPSRLIESQPSPSQSPFSSHVIASTETISAPITCTCTPCINLTSPNLYCKRLSTDSNITLLPCDNDFITNDCKSFHDQSIVHDWEIRHSVASISTLPDV